MAIGLARALTLATDVPMLIGYAYTSTGDQDLNQQRAALMAAGCTQIYEDRLTSGDPRPQRKLAFDQLRDGDILVITKLDRLTAPFGRFELTQFADLLKGCKSDVRSLGEPWVNATCLLHSWLRYEEYKKDPIALKPIYEAFVQMVFENGDTIKIDYPYFLTLGYHTHSIIEPWTTSPSDLLEIFLHVHDSDIFSYERARQFCDNLRKIGRWLKIKFELDKWFKRTLRDPFIAPVTIPMTLPLRRLREDVDVTNINQNLFEFACYIAVCNLKYGASYDYLAANEIFDVVTALGSKLPSRLKMYGTGALPRAVTDYMDEEVTFKANDAFATIRIVVKNESEDNYRKVLDQLARLLAAEFPRSYAIEFRSPNKAFLPIKGLPKKGVHQLFANAANYPVLRPLIEQYARSAMREFELYSNMPEENPVMPGTFAVFALILADDAYIDLTLDYLRLCDGEHQSAHGNLIHAYLGKHGFTSNAIRLLIATAGNVQNMSAHKTYPSLIANRNGLELLAQARKTQESEALASKPNSNALWSRDPGRAWQNLLIAIWGETAVNSPEKIIKAAPEDLRSLYRSILC
jgi:hypothetical protein